MRKIGTKAIQAYTGGITFTWDGRLWVCDRNKNVKYLDKDFKYEKIV